MPWGGEKGHQEIRTCLSRYMACNWETLQKEHIVKAHVLVSQIFLEMALDPIPPPSAWLCHAQTLLM